MKKGRCCPSCGYDFKFKWVFIQDASYGNVTYCPVCNSGVKLDSYSYKTAQIFKFFFLFVVILFGGNIVVWNMGWLNIFLGIVRFVVFFLLVFCVIYFVISFSTRVPKIEKIE
jgi:hypothetical protein